MSQWLDEHRELIGLATEDLMNAVERHGRKVRPRTRTEARFRRAIASSPETSQPSACSRFCHTRAHHPARPLRQAAP
jgi:hypothetical protein